MYDVLNTLSEYTYFHISLLLLVSRIIESLQFILNTPSKQFHLLIPINTETTNTEM